jgi:hypothetical protein
VAPYQRHQTIRRITLGQVPDNETLDPLLIRNEKIDRSFTEFGGITDARGFRPTRETALFRLTGEDMSRRIATMRLFADDAPLVSHHLLERHSDPVAPWLSRDPHSDLLAQLVAAAAQV